MLKEFTSGFLLYSYRGRGGPSGGPHMPWHSLALAQAVRPICVFFNLEGILVWNSNQHNCEVKLTTLRELKSELYIDGSHVHISKQLNGKRNPPHSATSIHTVKKISSPHADNLVRSCALVPHRLLPYIRGT
jgi:hypothetical protein